MVRIYKLLAAVLAILTLATAAAQAQNAAPSTGATGLELRFFHSSGSTKVIIYKVDAAGKESQSESLPGFSNTSINFGREGTLYRFKLADGTVIKDYLVTSAASQSIDVFAPDTGSAVTVKEMQDLLDYHNKLRKDVGVNPVKWSPTIAKGAQAWADQIARTGIITHSTQPEPRKYGENYAYGSGDGYDVMSGAKFWSDESQFYVKGTPIPQAADFGNFKAAHYIQMVWKDTTEIGIGKATIQTGANKGSLIIVGNYGPPGNFYGQLPY